MRRFLALIFFLLPLSGWGYIWSPSSPKTLLEADTILLVPTSGVKVSYLNAGAVMGPITEGWEIASPIVLKGSVGSPARFTFTGYGVGPPPLATNYLIFLKDTGEGVKPVAPDLFAVGLTGNFDVVRTELGQVKPEAWTLISHCLIEEKDPACALHQSYLLSDAPPDILQATWKNLKGQTQKNPDLRLAYQNIGMRVEGVSALNGFVEPDFNNEPSYDPTGARGPKIELISTMTAWFDRDFDHEDYHNILHFVRGQRGEVGMRALMAIMRSTQKRDLPELLDIFEHSPSMDIRYACIHNFDCILGHPQPPEVIGWGDFKKHPEKYTRLWKSRVELALGE